MEEKIGEIWHRLITRMAATGYPEEAIRLNQIRYPLGILFRALGGDGGLQLAPAQATEYNGRRTLLQHLAGSAKRIRLAWRDQQSLHLPPVIDCFPSAQLN
ncbi:MAG: nitric oxide reductase, partial [Chromatiales bacterium]